MQHQNCANTSNHEKKAAPKMREQQIYSVIYSDDLSKKEGLCVTEILKPSRQIFSSP